MINIWSTYDQHMINIWSTYDQHMINIWSTYDQHMINIWSTYDQHMINIRSTYDQHMINIWSTYDQHMMDMHVQHRSASFKGMSNFMDFMALSDPRMEQRRWAGQNDAMQCNASKYGRILHVTTSLPDFIQFRGHFLKLIVDLVWC